MVSLMTLIGEECGLVGRAVAQQRGVSLDDVEDVVEVVRDAAGQRADALHLLCLQELHLELFTLVDLVHQLGRALRNSRLELRVRSCSSTSTALRSAISFFA